MFASQLTELGARPLLEPVFTRTGEGITSVSPKCEDFRLQRSRHLRAIFSDVDVEFTAYPEVFQVDPRFDGTGDSGDDLPRIMRLQVVEVDSIAMHRSA